MGEKNVTSVVVSVVGETVPSAALIALRRYEEQACARYLIARKAMLRCATRAASLRQLVAERSGASYRAALTAAQEAYSAASERTRLAHGAWQRAQLLADSEWTGTIGAARGNVAPVAVSLAGAA